MKLCTHEDASVEWTHVVYDPKSNEGIRQMIFWATKYKSKSRYYVEPYYGTIADTVWPSQYQVTLWFEDINDALMFKLSFI